MIAAVLMMLMARQHLNAALLPGLASVDCEPALHAPSPTATPTHQHGGNSQPMAKSSHRSQHGVFVCALLLVSAVGWCGNAAAGLPGGRRSAVERVDCSLPSVPALPMEMCTCTPSCVGGSAMASDENAQRL